MEIHAVARRELRCTDTWRVVRPAGNDAEYDGRWWGSATIVVLAGMTDVALAMGVEIRRMDETRRLSHDKQRGEQPHERPAPAFNRNDAKVQHGSECSD